MAIQNQEEVNYDSLFEYYPRKINVNNIIWVIHISSLLALHESSTKGAPTKHFSNIYLECLAKSLK